MSKVYFFLNDAPPEGGPLNRREVFWKQNCAEGYYDPSLRRAFSSKQQMRAYLASHKMRDAGERVNPNKHISGRAKSPVSTERQFAQAWVRQQGGTEGLLRRLQEGRAGDLTGG